MSEDVVGLIQLSDAKAESLRDSLISLGFNFENCRGQGYHGAFKDVTGLKMKTLPLCLSTLCQPYFARSNS